MADGDMMTALTRQTRAEFRKWRTLRASWSIAIAVVAADLILKSTSMLLVERSASNAAADTLFALRPSILHPVLLAALGVLIAASEWRHDTAVPTYSIQPNRSLVLAAKAICGATLGLSVATVSAIVSSGFGIAIAQQRNLPLPNPTVIMGVLAGSVLGGAVLVVIGVALGTVLTSQIGALAVVTVLFLAIGPATLLVNARVYAVLPGGALDTLAGQRPANPDLLGLPAATVLLAGYVVTLLAVATREVRRRSIT